MIRADRIAANRGTLNIKLINNGVNESIRLHDLQLDYVRAQYPKEDKKALALIHGAIRLSSNVVAKDPQQFASQIIGRLLPLRDASAVQHFMDGIATGAARPWLRPLHPALHPSGGALLCTLEGHSGPVSGVAVTPDGKRAVSASWDKTLKVWELESGVARRTLQGHSDSVRGVAVTPDGKRAVSASGDKTLKVWDLDAGEISATFTCDARVVCCGFSGDERLIVAGDAGGRVHFLQFEELVRKE